MHNIGIMQGRILPNVLDKLQVFPSRNWLQEFGVAKQIGFDYIELLYDRDEDPENPLVSSARMTEIFEIVRQNDMKLHSICADYFTKINFLEDPIDKTYLKLSGLLNNAIKLRAKLLVIPFFDKNELADKSCLKRFLNEYRSHIKHVCENDIEICIETTLRAEGMLKAIDETDSDMKICYDLGNATSLGCDVRGEIITLSDRIALVHIKDRKKNGGPNVPLGQGDVEFESSFKALKEINYQGEFTLETAIGQRPEKNATKHFKFASELVREIL